MKPLPQQTHQVIFYGGKSFCAKFFSVILFLFLGLTVVSVQGADQYFAGDGSAFTATKWGASGGPYTSTFVSGNVANFSVANGTAAGAGGISVAGLNATENFTYSATASGTLLTGGAVVPVTVAAGKTLDLGSTLTISAATGVGFSKNGPGVFAMAGSAFTGGFTNNAGVMVARGVNAMGAGGSLTINGGTIAGTATRDFTGKYTGITVGGDFQLGALATDVSISSSTANLTFDGAMSLGSATRSITIGANGTYTLSGVISGTGSAGLTVNAVSGATGKLSLTAVNTYSGDTTLTSGTLLMGNSSVVLGNSTGAIKLNGGTLQIASGANRTVPNPITMAADSIVSGVSSSTSSRGSTGQFIAFSTGTFVNTAGTLTIRNIGGGAGTLFGLRFTGGGFTFSRPISVDLNTDAGQAQLEFSQTSAAGDQTFSGIISGGGTGNGNVLRNSTGTTILTGANTYKGGTWLAGGFLGLGVDSVGTPPTLTSGAIGTGALIVTNIVGTAGVFASGGARTVGNAINFGSLTNTLTIAGTNSLTLSGAVNLGLFGQILKVDNLTNDTTISGVISGGPTAGPGLTKIGNGNLVLSGANTYVGSTLINAGKLALTGSGSIGASTNISINGGATLDLTGLNSSFVFGTAQTLAGASTNGATATLNLSSTVGLTLGSASPLRLAYSNSLPALTVTGGVLTISGGSTGTVTVANGGVGLPAADYKLISAINSGSVAGSAPATLVLAGDGISGAGASLVISNSELYLRVTNAPVPPATPVANVASATNVTTFTASWNGTVGAAGYWLDVSTANDFSSYLPDYAGRDVGSVTAFAVTNLNPNTVYYYQVRATNVYGSTTSAVISVTTLVAPYVWNAADGNWSAASSWQYANVPGNGVSVGFTGAGGNSTNDLSGLLLGSLTFSNGAGTYVLSGNPVVVSNGIANNSTAGEFIAAPLTLGAAQTISATAGSLTFVGPVTNAGNLLTVSATANVTNSGSISGTGGLTKTGTGTLVLAGTNTFSGSTTISAGTVKLAGGGALDDAATVTLANVATATLALDNSEAIGLLAGGGATGGTLALGANNLTVSGTGNFTGPVTGTGKLIKSGVGTLTLDRTTAYGSDFILRVEGGTADLNRGGTALTGMFGTGNRFELAGGTLQLSASAQANFALSIAGLDVFADSTLLLNRNSAGTSSQSPTITLPLNFKADSKLIFAYNANITGGTTTFDGANNNLQGNATLQLGAFAVTIANPIVETGGSYGLTKTGAGQLTLNAINTYSGPTTNLQGTIAVNATSTFGDGTGTLVLAGGDILNANTRAGAPIANPIVMTANTTIYGNGTLTDGSARYFPLSSSSINTVGGTLTVRNAGASGINEFRLRFTGGGFNFTQPIVIGSASDVSTLTSALQFYADTNVAAQTFSGNISGLGSINKSAPTTGTGGITILSGSNTYAGTTTVSEGLLLVNNTSGSGTGTNTVFVTSGGALGGTGIILGKVTNSFGSTLAPGLGGNNIATLTISNSLGLAGNALFTINRTNTQNASKLAGLTAVRYGGTLTLTNVGQALQAGDTFVLFNAAGYSGGFTNFVLPTLDSSLIWNTNNLAINGTLAVVPAITPTVLTLSSPANPAGYLAALTFTATVTPTNAPGSVIFATAGGAFSTNALVAGTAASASLNTLPRGTNLITAVYAGNASFTPSTNTFLQVVTNHPPVANPVVYSRNGLNTWKVALTNLLLNTSDADGDPVTFVSVGSSTNGVSLTSNSDFILYANTNLVNDQFTYTVTDGQGGTTTATITLQAGNGVAASFSSFTLSGGQATLNISGIPGYLYNVQVSSNLVTWATVWSTNAPSNGQFQFIDANPPQPSAYYRLMWNGN